MARDLRAEFGLRLFSLFGSGGAAFTGLGAQERAYGFHAGEVETSFLLSAIPGAGPHQRVHRELHCGY